MSRVAIVEGIRTPFIKSWTLFKDIPAPQLGAICVRELLERLAFNAKDVDEIILGCVAQPPDASNIARIISLYAGLPKEKPAYTISRNCASGLEAVSSAVEKILAGVDRVVIAGGVESMSNIPFFFGKEMGELLVRLAKAKTLKDRLKGIMAMRPRHFKPYSGLLLGLRDPICGLNMGQTAEELVKELGIKREEQDLFALESHQKATRAKEKLKEEIMDVYLPPKFDKVVKEDNGPRHNQTLEALLKLKPYFDKYTGTVTAGNSSQITDGAVALLLMKEELAKSLGYQPLGYIRVYTYVGLEPRFMGLGPAYAIPLVLEKAGVSFKDIGLVEINEAFAAQVLASLKLLSSQEFIDRNFSHQKPIKIEREILNVNGGAIALGHPVGATGARLILTILKEMKRKGIDLGLVSLCVGGGQGGAMVLER